METITSLQNPRVKGVVRLGSRRERDREQRTVVEGVRETSLALARGVIPVEAFVCRDYLAEKGAQALLSQLQQLATAKRTKLFDVSPAVYDKMAYRSGSEGVLLVIPFLTRSLDDLGLGARPFLAIVDGVEKPGNLGAILRTADAAGLDALVLTDEEGGGTDIHNPNAIRASLGAFFTVPVVTTTRRQALSWLRSRDIAIVATTPEAETLYTRVDYAGPVAIVMGSEAQGLDQQWLQTADYQVRLPMAGMVDSLNLSVATALLLYEVVRQRDNGDNAGGQTG